MALQIETRGFYRLIRAWVIVCIACLMQSVLSAQAITVSQEIPLKNDYAYDIVGKLGDHVLLFREQQNKFEIHAYDDAMRLRWERPLNFERNRIDIISLVPADETFHLVYGYRHKGDYYVKHRHYDADADVIDSTTIDVVEKLYFSPRYKHTYSQDKTKLLLFRVDKESEMLAYAYDLNEQETLWTKQISFKGGVLRRDFRWMIVSNDADMFMVMDHSKNSMRHKEFNVMRIVHDARAIAIKEVNLNGTYAFDLFVTYDNVNQELILTGLYNEKAQSRSQGIYVARLGLYENRPTVRLIPFTEDLLQEVHGKDVSLKKGISDFEVQDIVLRQDGGALIIAEMNKEYSRRPNVPIRRDGGFGRGGWVDYYFEDMILLSIHPNDTEHWRTVLHKKQYSQDDDGMYSSYFLFKTPEKVRLLFNDEIRQENTVSEYTIRGNGYYKRKSVFSTDYQRLRLRFRDAVQVAYNECVVPSERNNRLNLVRIRFQ